LQPYQSLTNEQVWLLIDSGGFINKPDKCPDSFFEKVILPCFQTVPQSRPSFGGLSDAFAVLLSQDEFLDFGTIDGSFPRFDSSAQPKNGRKVGSLTLLDYLSSTSFELTLKQSSQLSSEYSVRLIAQLTFFNTCVC
jgi:hypothetical protein